VTALYDHPVGPEPAGCATALCVIGDALLDVDWNGTVDRVCRDAPALVLDTPDERARPGGAALAATLAAGSGAEVVLVTALSQDADGHRLAELLERAGVGIVDLGLHGPTPVKLRLRAGDQSIARVDKGCSPTVPPGRWSASARAAIAKADALLVSDYGRGVAALPEVASAVGSFPGPTVWDPHRDGPLPPGATTLSTPNHVEAHHISGGAGSPPERLPGVVCLARNVAARLGCRTVVTAGPLGAVVADGGSAPTVVPAAPLRGDPCGAGDRFAVSAALALAGGASVVTAVGRAVADAGAFIASGNEAGALARPPASRVGRDPVVRLRPGGPLTAVADAATTAAAVRGAGGVVVAAGGCFDVLHTGHVRLLDEARRLGDHLVVCLNGDDSVRRLKGSGRPLNVADDRATVLRSMACVDAVVVFDEDTPCDVLRVLRPHLFVKGADYQDVDLDERRVLAEWGGEVVLLPLVGGRSTTRLLSAAAHAAM
jgi:D-beta-D-heptose 7-phosphate kinase / D-beta-D-heptose 1-phosphate adenosyltransferase